MVGKISSLLGALLVAVTVGISPAAFAIELNTEYDLYGTYDAGYDTDFSDDWFFDYYEVDPATADIGYEYYSGFDYTANAFEWEEEGLFE
jgi:opacity protein-like surface antigen